MGSKNRSLGGLAVEGFLIIASILIAFFLDAWWGEREAQHQLNQELQSVAREVTENRALVEYDVNSLERITNGSQALLSRLEEGTQSQLVPVQDTLLFFVTFFSPTLDLSFGALDALIASGRLAQIEDPELRLRLAGLRDLVGDAVGDELLAQTILMEQVFPAVSKDADLSVAYRIDTAFGALDRKVDQPIPTEQISVPIPASLELTNAIRNRTSWAGTALGEMRRLLEDLERLRYLIENGVR